MKIEFFLKCNKIKALKAKAADIVSSVEESDQVEVSPCSVFIRRIGNKALPALEAKTGSKRKTKEEEKKTVEEEKKEEDPKVLTEADY